MGLKVNDINQLDPQLVENAQAELSQLIQERHPQVELTRGVIHDIVAFFAGGVSGGINQTEVNRVLESRSLLAIQTNPELADPELVDHVLSNFLITRRTGTRASGEIAIVVEGDTTVVVAANSRYIANGVNYLTNEPIIARPPGTVTTEPNERVLEPRGDGSFEFTVPATAEDVGEVGNARTGAKFLPDVPPPRFVTAFANTDFTSGTSSETNEQLIERMLAGIPAQTTAGRLNIEALIKAQPVFGDVRDVSIIGFGDAEMTRDQHWIFPVSGGGRIDIYGRTDALPQTVVLRKNARLVDYTPGVPGGTWQFSLDRDDAPGFYEVVSVRRTDAAADIAGFGVTSEIRGFHFADDKWKPDIQSVNEAIYSRYQTAVIQFVDDITVITPEIITEGSREYVVSVSTQPLIRELQEFLASNDHRHLASDILVKSAVPCFLSINCDIIKSSNESAPELAEIRAAIARQVNLLDFPGTIYASQITDVIHNFLEPGQAVSIVDMHGRIRRPDGDDWIIRNTNQLTIPNSPSTGVTPRTTTFMLYPDDIGLAVVNRDNC